MERSLITLLRALRNRVPIIASMHRHLRDPYYRMLEVFCPRGFPTRLASGDAVRLQVRFLGMRPQFYEPVLTAEFIRHLRPGGIVLDIGAHVGLHTLLFSERVGSSGQVLAVEPSPANAGLLRKHLSWNRRQNVKVIEAAIGDKIGEVNFVFRSDATDPAGFANSLAYDNGGDTVSVHLTTIDELCRALVPDLIKIDVEGAELLALRGAEKTLTKSSPVLIVAIHPDPMKLLNTTPQELVAFLRALGYEGRHLDGRPAVDPGFEEIIFEKRQSLHE